MIWLLLLQLLAPVYHPETIDSLGWSSYNDVSIEGIVGGIMREGFTVSFRLADTHGHHRVCVLPVAMDPPKVGAHIRVTGTRKYYPAKGIAEVDPVAGMVPVED